MIDLKKLIYCVDYYSDLVKAASDEDSATDYEDAEQLLVEAKQKCKGTKSAPVGSPRQRAFCKRMCGHRKKNTGSEAAKDPDSCINQALRRWKCRCPK